MSDRTAENQLIPPVEQPEKVRTFGRAGYKLTDQHPTGPKRLALLRDIRYLLKNKC